MELRRAHYLFNFNVGSFLQVGKKAEPYQFRANYESQRTTKKNWLHYLNFMPYYFRLGPVSKIFFIFYSPMKKRLRKCKWSLDKCRSYITFLIIICLVHNFEMVKGRGAFYLNDENTHEVINYLTILWIYKKIPLQVYRFNQINF